MPICVDASEMLALGSARRGTMLRADAQAASESQAANESELRSGAVVAARPDQWPRNARAARQSNECCQ